MQDTFSYISDYYVCLAKLKCYNAHVGEVIESVYPHLKMSPEDTILSHENHLQRDHKTKCSCQNVMSA